MKEDNWPTDNSHYRAKLFVPTTFPSHQEMTDDGLRSVYFHGRIATAVASKIGARLWERLSNSLTLNQAVLSSGSWRKLAFLAFSCLKSVLWIDKFERVLNIITMVAQLFEYGVWDIWTIFLRETSESRKTLLPYCSRKQASLEKGFGRRWK